MDAVVLYFKCQAEWAWGLGCMLFRWRPGIFQIFFDVLRLQQCFSQIPLRFPLLVFILGFHVVARLLFSGVFPGFRSSLRIDPKMGIDGVLSDLCPGSD